jgi:purine-binding chemotaxis protein CheW
MSNIIEDFFRHRATIARHRIIWYHEKVSLNHGGIKMETTQIAVFTSGEYVCGIETEKINTIIRYQQPETVEGAPEFIEGLIKWKDSTIPVVDLRVMFGEGETRVTKKTKILIVDTSGQLAGFIVDDINIIRKYSEDEIEAAPPVLTQYETGYLKAVCKSEGGLVPVLDFDKILTDSEIGQFASITR